MELNSTSQIASNTPVNTLASSLYNNGISNEVVAKFNTYLNSWISISLTCLGLFTNSFNIAVFVNQGFGQGVTITMTSIAVWDLLKCTCAFIHRLFGPISLVSPPMGYSWIGYTRPNIEYAHIFAGYVSFALTAFVSIERCLCVWKPFTVKSVFTVKFTTLMVLIISVMVFGSYVVMFFIYDVELVFNPELNSIVAVYVYNKFYHANKTVVLVYYQVAGITLPTLSITILCICSATTVYHLRKSQDFLRFRQKSEVGIPLKEKQVVKMLLTVIFVNIGNLLPHIVFYTAQLVEPEFYLLRKYNNIFFVTRCFITVLDFIKSSVNFFIYYRMSSNFHATFSKLFVPPTRLGLMSFSFCTNKHQ